MSGGALGLSGAATGWLLFASLATAIGAAVGRSFILSPGDAPGRRAAARLGLAAALILTAALALVFLRQFLEFRDPFAPWTDDAALLLGGTAWGTTWCLAVATSWVAQAGFWLAAREKRMGGPLAMVAVLALGAFPALTGHANAGSLRPVTLMADTLHVWAAGAWMGGLALVLFLEFRHRRAVAGTSSSLLPTLVPRFSRVALGSVVTLVTTGIFASWVHVESPAALLGTIYGRLLLLKLLLVGVVFALGALNYRRLSPNLADTPTQATMRRAATMELVAANVVFVVTSVLVQTSPR